MMDRRYLCAITLGLISQGGLEVATSLWDIEVESTVLRVFMTVGIGVIVAVSYLIAMRLGDARHQTRPDGPSQQTLEKQLILPVSAGLRPSEQRGQTEQARRDRWNRIGKWIFIVVMFVVGPIVSVLSAYASDAIFPAYVGVLLILIVVHDALSRWAAKSSDAVERSLRVASAIHSFMVDWVYWRQLREADRRERDKRRAMKLRRWFRIGRINDNSKT